MRDPDNPAGDPHVKAHKAGEAAGHVIGAGLGVVLSLVLLLLLLGPVLWAPALAGLAAARGVPGPWWPWIAGVLAAVAVGFLQFLMLVQKSPVLRYPTIVLFAFVWVGGLWLEATAPRHDWLTTAPAWHAPGPWSWALIGVGTLVYSGLYLLATLRFAKGGWARRWQLIK